VPERKVADYAHWHAQTLRLNEQYVSPTENPTESGNPEPRSWIREISVGVVVAVLAAAIVAWLGLGK
jgi:hypothetical protein